MPLKLTFDNAQLVFLVILYLEASFLSPEGGRYIQVGDRGQIPVVMNRVE